MTAHPIRVLFVEDDDDLRHATMQGLRLAEIEATAFSDAESMLSHLQRDFDGVVVTDIRLPKMSGLALLEIVAERDPDLPVILVTGHGDVPMAVAALKRGAFDFLTKPFNFEHLVDAITRAAARRHEIIQRREITALLALAEEDGPLLGRSPAMIRLRDQVSELAKVDVDVLIEGEPGTGKDLVAAVLHRHSRRKANPFVTVECGTLSAETAEIVLFGHVYGAMPHIRGSREGLITMADGGTLLLDGIDLLPAAVQTQILRVLEDREIRPIGSSATTSLNLRVVATSRRPLSEAVREGLFRDDLHRRLSLASIRVPPIREREGDSLLLFTSFVKEAQTQFQRPDWAMSPTIRNHVLAHSWLGNVRELRQYAYQCLLDASNEIESGQRTLRAQLATFERDIIKESLESSGGNIVKACDVLGIGRKTLYEKMAKYDIDPATFRPR